MNSLFEEFTESNAVAWKAKLQKDLKGISFEDLISQDRNGIDIQPFYTIDELPQDRKNIITKKDWIICTAIDNQDGKQANEQALEHLANGASGLCFHIEKDTDLNILLEGVELQHIYSQFTIHSDMQQFIGSLELYLQSKDLSLQNIHCHIIADGIAQHIIEKDFNETRTQQASSHIIQTTGTLSIDANSYQNAGANSVTQLANTIAQLNEYLHWAAQANELSAIHTIAISLTVGTDFFEEIAKFRALRILVANMMAQYNIEPKLHLHITTSDTYRAGYDAYSNLLRDAIAGMAAVLGGCDSLLVNAFDKNSATKQAKLSSRMSRNQQLIFKEESYLHQIADAGSGAYFIEKLTEQIAQKAWAAFQNIEANGGFLSCFAKGILQKEINEQAAAWIAEYKKGKRVLIGVNKYVNADDKPEPTAAVAHNPQFLRAINIANEII
ncbi:MAG: hypothetical protein IT256_06345 [Chitinophagaceae bacterium]|nr:hypothetical protein [Chitinophagaceae bacterium]